jgi:hypothetical protein
MKMTSAWIPEDSSAHTRPSVRPAKVHCKPYIIGLTIRWLTRPTQAILSLPLNSCQHIPSSTRNKPTKSKKTGVPRGTNMFQEYSVSIHGETPGLDVPPRSQSERAWVNSGRSSVASSMHRLATANKSSAWTPQDSPQLYITG